LNAAYLETPTSTHICVWVQDEKYVANGKTGYTNVVVTLCGKKKAFLKRPKLIYPGGAPSVGINPEKKACRVCEHVIAEATDLTLDLVGS
jgi:hypothetical protein